MTLEYIRQNRSMIVNAPAEYNTDQKVVSELKVNVTKAAVANVRLDVLGACTVAEAQFRTIW